MLSGGVVVMRRVGQRACGGQRGGFGGRGGCRTRFRRVFRGGGGGGSGRFREERSFWVGKGILTGSEGGGGIR